MTDRKGFDYWVIRNAPWLLVGQLIITILLLGAIATITLTNQRHINDIQAQNLATTRAVVRCATTETTIGLQRVVDQLGIRIRFDVPNTEGLDCDVILNIPLEAEPHD